MSTVFIPSGPRGPSLHEIDVQQAESDRASALNELWSYAEQSNDSIIKDRVLRLQNAEERLDRLNADEEMGWFGWVLVSLAVICVVAVVGLMGHIIIEGFFGDFR